MARVSVIIPVYNGEEYLPPCLDSMAAQTLGDMEVILVDDGSSDGSGALCDAYAARDGRFSVIHQPNRGVVSALLAGLAAAAGTYVGFVDADDWVDADYFAHLYDRARQTGADVVQAERIEERARPEPLIQPETRIYEGAEDMARLMEMFFTLFRFENARRPITYARWDKLYRRELIGPNLGLLDEGLYLSEDALFNAAMLPDCKRVAVLSGTPKYHYRIRSGSNSHRFDPREMERIAQLHADLVRVAGAKGVDPALPELYTGYGAYCRIYAAAGLPGVSVAQRTDYVRTLLAAAPAGTLARYAAYRGGLFIRLYCAMLEKGLLLPCVLAASLHSRLGQGSSFH